jgi:hypothetical protein
MSIAGIPDANTFEFLFKQKKDDSEIPKLNPSQVL